MNTIIPEELNMPVSLETLQYRRQLLPDNPYFQQELALARKGLGLPSGGFSLAVEELEKDFPANECGFRTGAPDMEQLLLRAEELELPLAERIGQWKENVGGLVGQVQSNLAWGALPIFSALDWATWWLRREAAVAGIQSVGAFSNLNPSPSISPWDTRLPTNRRSLELCQNYQLGEDFAPEMGSLVMGCPTGGGHADVMLTLRQDGTVQQLTLNNIPDNCTRSEWQEYYDDCIQPSLGSKKRRPPQQPDPQSLEWTMWRYWYDNFYPDFGPGAKTFEAFLESIPDEDSNKVLFETMELETFRRAVKQLDQQMSPTEIRPEFPS